MLLTRIELVFLLYQSSVLPFNYKSYGTPPPTRTGNTLLLREPRLPIAPVGHVNGASGEIRTPITWFRRPGTAPSAEANFGTPDRTRTYNI